jgi:hypothetical protein
LARGSSRNQRLILLAAALSFAWLLAGAFFPRTLGGYYSTLRFGVIYANCFAMLVCSILAFRKKVRPLATGIACLMLAALWFFVAAINSTV